MLPAQEPCRGDLREAAVAIRGRCPLAELGSACLHHLPVMVADGEELVEGDYDHAVRKSAADRIDGFQSQADEMMKMDHVRLQVAQDAQKVAFELFGVPVRDQEVVVLIGMVEDIRRPSGADS